MFEPSPLERLRARGRMRHGFALLGPAFVAAVAYVDPGNFATNIAGGAKYGYLLLWVILAANLMAMLIQYLSAKVGVVTGRSLPELCREHFPRRVSFGLWVQAELIAMATDLAEFVGAAIALNLLFGVPLFTSGLITAVVAFAILGLQTRGYRRFETTIMGLLGVVLLGFVWELLHSGADPGGVAAGFVPGFAGTESILLATGILGATVMPHVIYLHSALTQNRIRPWNDGERRAAAALRAPGRGPGDGHRRLVNISMLVVAAALFHGVVGRRLDRGGARRLPGPARHRRRRGVRHRTAGMGAVQLERGHLRGPGGHAGLHSPLDPAGGAPSRDDDPGPGDPGPWPGSDAVPGGEPGGAVLRHPVRAGTAGAAHPPAGHHGLVRERPRHDGRGQRGGRPDHRAQPFLWSRRSRADAGPPVAFRPMPLADDFQALVDALPPDWSQLEADLRIDDEDRYIEAATLLSQVNAMPYSLHDWHWRLRSAREFGHAAAPQTVRGTLALLDDQGITGTLAPREARSGRVEVTQMWGRPESVRQEFARRRGQ